jgi:hypothetical protein
VCVVWPEPMVLSFNFSLLLCELIDVMLVFSWLVCVCRLHVLLLSCWIEKLEIGSHSPPSSHLLRSFRLRYNLLSISQLCDAGLSVLFCMSNSHVLDSSGKRVCGISRIGDVF